MDDDGYKLLVDAYNDPAQASKRDRIAKVIAKAGRPLPGAASGGPPELNAKRKATSYADQVRMTHAPGEGASQDVVGLHENDPESENQRNLRTFNQGADAVATSIAHPIETISSPTRRRQTLRGIDDMVTLGHGQELADAATNYVRKKAALPVMPGDVREMTGPTFSESEQNDEEVAPGFRTMGRGIGAGMPGVTSYIARNAGTVGAAIGGRLPKAIPGAIRGTLGGVAGYELAAPGIAAASAGAAGDRGGAAKEAATDPLGLLLSGTFGGVGGAGRAKAAKIRDPETPSGKVIADVKAAGGTIRPFGEPVKGGMYEQKALRDLDPGREGVNELAGQSVERIHNANQGKLKTANSQIGETIDDVIMEHGKRPFETPEAHTSLDAMTAENLRDNGTIRSPEVAGALDRVREMLTQTTGGTDKDATLKVILDKIGIPESRRAKMSPEAKQQVLAQASPEEMVGGPARQITARDLVLARKDLRQMANNAATPSENRVYQVILEALDKDAELIDPRIKQMNSEYHRAMVPIETSNDMIFGKRTKDLDMNEAARTTGVQRIGTMTDDTQSGTNRRLANRLAEVGPDYEREVQLMRAKKAQERLRRGEPEVSTAIEKQAAGAARRSARGQTIGALLAGIPGVALGYGVDKLRENPLPNQVRVTLPVSETAGKLTGAIGTRADAIAAAAHRRGKKKKNGAEMSLGGATD